MPDILRVIAGRYGEVPSYLGSAYFWISLVVLVALGGVAAGFLAPPVDYSQLPSMISPLAIGYSAPSVISKLLSQPDVRVTERGVASARTLRGWWAS